MNKLYKLSVIVIVVLIASCTSSPSSIKNELNPKRELLSLDKAIDSAVAAVEAKVAGGTEIVVYEITASNNKIGNYMGDNLNDRFAQSGKLKPLARKSALNVVLKEQELQMLGIVTDKSAVEVGNLLSAKVVITGTFDCCAGFSQLRIRVVDAQKSALLFAYDVHISNSDTVLAGIITSFGVTLINEETLAHLTRGRDFYARGRTYSEELNNAIREFGQAIVLAPDFADAYFNRGNAYYKDKDYDHAIVDYTDAIKIDPKYADAYNNRGNAYADKKDYDRAIADYTQTIKLNPNRAITYNNRASVYHKKKDYDRAIADFNQIIKLDPRVDTYNNRGLVYLDKGDYDRAIADFNQIIKLFDPKYYRVGGDNMGGREYYYTIYNYGHSKGKPNESIAIAYNNRANAYYKKKDYDRAIKDFNEAIKMSRGFVYVHYLEMKKYGWGDSYYSRTLMNNTNYVNAGKGLEMAKQAKAAKK